MSWEAEKNTLLTDARASGEKLTMLGDNRSDSPGHCAKYGTYSLLDGKTGKVMAMEVVQVCIHQDNM